MSQENVELARATLNAFTEMDEGLVGPERLWEFIARDVLATFSGFGFVDEQTFRGLEFLEFRASWMARTTTGYTSRRKFSTRARAR